MKRAEGIAFLTQCADRQGIHWSSGIKYPADDCPTCGGSNYAGFLLVPCSRYGRNASECAPKVWRAALKYQRESGEEITLDLLDSLMSRAVNDQAPIY